MLVDARRQARYARLRHDRQRRRGTLWVHTWQPVDYADGLVRVGVQSAVAHPEAGLLMRKLMTEQGLEAPPVGRTLASVCITEICDAEEPEQQ